MGGIDKIQKGDKKQPFICLRYDYNLVPQYLNVGYMTEKFVKSLSKGEKLRKFIADCKKNQKEAQNMREERKKFIRKQLIQAKFD